MYDSRFEKAVVKYGDGKGKLMRNEKTKDLNYYCPHNYICKFETDYEMDRVGGMLGFERLKFDGVKGVCRNCGDVLMVSADNIFSGEEYEKEVERAAKDACEKGGEKK